ncbi:hypothetical protein H4R33_005306 [Dimargaris cristalligena]|uniref:Mediator of RNA polymerase II transcription subunit 8 n=1 Tax=Dimargaris cristalligena TaxID=215637 RepID=A0A4P9ZMT7_9FUNG|nr:hypothetical protein H4R33_005306 [Dimargaris cristalligena]RKP34607.1 hypothetical protein BJ085DRAFT_34404 [Dimargaris cristalligena]|eukprot:RKP34607.1 hypothetical protein BJ085DRAFT_34404 [Dimargaris cristalligena]
MDPFHDNAKQIIELESLRTKLQQLKESFVPFLQVTDPHYPYPVPWPEVLNKFNILVARFVSLSRVLGDQPSSSLRKLVLHPNEPVGSDQEQQIMSILLRTKPIPEVENAQRGLVKEVDSTDLAGIQAAIQAKRQVSNPQVEELKAWKSKAEAHDTVCLSAEQCLKRYLEEYRSRLKLRIVDEATENAPGIDNHTPGSGPTLASNQIGLMKETASDLEKLMMFISTGVKI